MYTASGQLDRTQAVHTYLPMIRRHALALQVRLPPSVELDDLIQAGTMGLLDAFDRYESGQGATFATYASQRVRGAMIDELRSRDWLPRSVRRGARELSTAIERLEHRLGRAPREREIAEELDISLDDYHALLNDVNNGLILSYQEHGTPESEPSRLADSVETGGDPFLSTFVDARREDLMDAIDDLPERERMLLGLYYQEDLNLKEIGAVLGVTESRVCQLHSQAVARLRKALPAYAESS
ncbi:RNA polymerase sigma factor FliA [Salinisphaera sp.]|uniref:RNA polymerase sigma factor FliA n=1 Tax=Salinisphaera sp. TaxID=1914330 RepID=UPI002D791C8A|nr:RNA polymerase sigma factor FliA [Salinisphaera sp.]HET7313968.1 RNA polymerase sigma factor FliA [Salinisphaera sp.]